MKRYWTRREGEIDWSRNEGNLAFAWISDDTQQGKQVSVWSNRAGGEDHRADYTPEDFVLIVEWLNSREEMNMAHVDEYGMKNTKLSGHSRRGLA